MSMSNIGLWYLLSLLVFLADAYFTLSLVFFIISTVKKKHGATAGLAAHQRTWKIHFIISAVVLVLAVIAICVILTMQILQQPLKITLM
jgi:hypothetical protein